MKFLFYYRSVALICMAVLMPVLAALGYGMQSTVLNESTCVFLSMFSLFTTGVLLLNSELACFSRMQCWSCTDQDIEFTRKLSDLVTNYYALNWACCAVILTPLYLNSADLLPYAGS